MKRKTVRVFEYRPELRDEWDWDINIGLNPYQLTYGSNKIAWWKCQRGHHWKSAIAKRTIRGDGCPQCPKSLCQNGHSLQDENPKYLSEWSPQNLITPAQISFSSSKKVLWECDRGHEWKTSPKNRKRGRCFPYCSGFYCSIENSIFSLRKDLLTIWNYQKNTLSPKSVSVSSGKKVWWKCSDGHEWQSVVANISKGIGCPYCSGREATYEDNITNNAFLMKEWNYEKNKGINPLNVKGCSGKKFWWRCSSGHEWRSTPNKRSHGRGCPYCCKYELYNGEFCDSLIETFYYVMYEQNNVKFLHDQKYKKSLLYRYDFHLLESNTFVEVTSFSESQNYGEEQYGAYMKRINRKRDIVESLGGIFVFIQRSLSEEEINYVRLFLK